MFAIPFPVLTPPFPPVAAILVRPCSRVHMWPWVSGSCTSVPLAFLFALGPWISCQPSLHTTSDLLSATNVYPGFHPRIANQSESFVILVKSGIRNQEQRQAIRETWGQEVRPIFVLGYSTDAQVMAATVTERQEYGDLVMGSFEDNYYNLTLKSVFTLSWMRQHHPDKWLLTADDDVIVNVHILRQFNSRVTQSQSAEAIGTAGHESYGSREEIFCMLNQQTEPIRDPSNKWSVSEEVFAAPFYPHYCSGPAVLFAPTVFDRLLHACLDPGTEPKLWLEDIYVTGIAAEAANVTRVNSKSINTILYVDDCQTEQLIRLVAGGQYRVTELRSLWITMQHLRPIAGSDTLFRCRQVALVTKILAFFVLAAIASALFIAVLRFKPTNNRFFRPCKRLTRVFHSRHV